jgi:hypothetical protein
MFADAAAAKVSVQLTDSNIINQHKRKRARGREREEKCDAKALYMVLSFFNKKEEENAPPRRSRWAAGMFALSTRRAIKVIFSTVAYRFALEFLSIDT